MLIKSRVFQKLNITVNEPTIKLRSRDPKVNTFSKMDCLLSLLVILLKSCLRKTRSLQKGQKGQQPNGKQSWKVQVNIDLPRKQFQKAAI